MISTAIVPAGITEEDAVIVDLAAATGLISSTPMPGYGKRFEDVTAADVAEWRRIFGEDFVQLQLSQQGRRRLLERAAQTEGGSYGAVFVMGAMSGVVAAPCGAPAFAVVLTWVAATGAGLMGFVYLFVFSLGMTSLLVAVGLFSGTLAILPNSGVWMVWVKRVAGVIMIGVAEYYFGTAGYNL